MVCFLRFTQLDLISNQVNMMRIKIWDRKKRRKMLVFSINIMIRKYDKCLFETLIVTGTQHEVLISLWLYVVLQSVWYVSLHCGGRKSSSKCVIGYHVQEHCFRWIHISAKDSFFLFINWCPRSYMVYITCWAISHAKLTHHVTHRNKQCAWNHMGLILDFRSKKLSSWRWNGGIMKHSSQVFVPGRTELAGSSVPMPSQ